MKFESLKIETVKYGADKGKLIAEICIHGDKSRTTMELPQHVGEKILQLAKNAIIDGVEKAANDFIFEITTAIPDTFLIGE
jgi:carbon monoxide dehydrogenase subunit G